MEGAGEGNPHTISGTGTRAWPACQIDFIMFRLRFNQNEFVFLARFFSRVVKELTQHGFVSCVISRGERFSAVHHHSHFLRRGYQVLLSWHLHTRDEGVQSILLTPQKVRHGYKTADVNYHFQTRLGVLPSFRMKY